MPPYLKNENLNTVRKGRIFCLLLLTWLVANALTHIIILIATGKIYYQLPMMGLLGAEASISFLNFLLPVLVVWYFFKEPVSFPQTFGFKWAGLKILLWSIGGFAGFMLLSLAANWLFNNQIIQYGTAGMTGPVTRLDYLLYTLMLLIFPAFGEETMFRGFLQTRLTSLYGPITGILVPAVLFAVRHHPSDIYFGVVNDVTPAGWINRAVQLYLGAVIFGLVRHYARSTWASWIMHMIIILLILILGGFLNGVLGG